MIVEKYSYRDAYRFQRLLGKSKLASAFAATRAEWWIALVIIVYCIGLAYAVANLFGGIVS